MFRGDLSVIGGHSGGAFSRRSAVYFFGPLGDVMGVHFRVDWGSILSDRRGMYRGTFIGCRRAYWEHIFASIGGFILSDRWGMYRGDSVGR